MELLGVLVQEKKILGWQRLRRQRLGERLGAPEVLIYGTGEEIMAGDRGAYPKKFGKWRDSLSRSSLGRLGFKLSYIRFDWLKSDSVAVGLFFGYDTVWSKLPNESRRNCSSK
jgi:hypothetical protein